MAAAFEIGSKRLKTSELIRIINENNSDFVKCEISKDLVVDLEIKTFTSLLTEAFTRNEHIRHIKVSNVSSILADTLADTLATSTFLDKLELHQIKSSGQYGVFQSFANFLNGVTENTNITGLANALKFNNSVSHLSICSSNIGNSGLILLSQSLKINKSIVHLSLRSNHISNGGVFALAEAIRINSSITHLDLSGNQIGDHGAIALVDAIKVNSSITHLNFSGNQIGDSGIIEIANILKANTSITHLGLNLSKMTDIGVASLIAALKCNPNITSLDLSVANPQLIIQIKQLLKENDRLSRTMKDIELEKPRGASLTEEVNLEKTVSMWFSNVSSKIETASDYHRFELTP